MFLARRRCGGGELEDPRHFGGRRRARGPLRMARTHRLFYDTCPHRFATGMPHRGSSSPWYGDPIPPDSLNFKPAVMQEQQTGEGMGSQGNVLWHDDHRRDGYRRRMLALPMISGGHVIYWSRC